ncbi:MULTISPECIES: hypothetical protein [Rhodococcus]|jgi:hypothetical protein|uniref:hypothetical protein n=1 Tax=Rhodococcus TaxID=1827 RepID=UPI0011D16D2B|nr:MULTISPECIES: hypothetical protein [Rhodococcus]
MNTGIDLVCACPPPITMSGGTLVLLVTFSVMGGCVDRGGGDSAALVDQPQAGLDGARYTRCSG